ncbi:MAG: amidase family protein [Pseudomonadota bacterium]
MQHWQLSAQDIAELVRSKAVSANEMTRAALQRCQDVNPKINAVVQDCADEALATAQETDRRIAAGEDPGLLAGVPVTIKVNADQQGYATTNGVRLQKDLIATQDNPVVANLKRAGAIIIGRTNTPAFSIRWFCRNGLHGWTRNPHDPKLTPGGSSGGAAAGLAAGIGALAHGTDIGGSIRYPAYACGVHGLRPSLGRVPAFNVTAGDRLIGGQLMSVSGPLARTIGDLRLALQVMGQPSRDDPWSVVAPPGETAVRKRVALCLEPEGMSVDAPVKAAVASAADKLRDAGWEVADVKPPSFVEPARLQAILWLGEFRHTNAAALYEENDADAVFVFQQMEALCSAPDLAGVMDALKERSRLARMWQAFLEDYPVLLCPVSGELPFPDQLDVQSTEAFARVMRAQLIQVGLPLMGLPGLTVTTDKLGTTPVGVQLIAARFGEDQLFAAGEAIAERSQPISVVDPI